MITRRFSFLFPFISAPSLDKASTLLDDEVVKKAVHNCSCLTEPGIERRLGTLLTINVAKALAKPIGDLNQSNHLRLKAHSTEWLTDNEPIISPLHIQQIVDEIGDGSIAAVIPKLCYDPMTFNPEMIFGLLGIFPKNI